MHRAGDEEERSYAALSGAASAAKLPAEYLSGGLSGSRERLEALDEALALHGPVVEAAVQNGAAGDAGSPGGARRKHPHNHNHPPVRRKESQDLSARQDAGPGGALGSPGSPGPRAVPRLPRSSLSARCWMPLTPAPYPRSAG